MRLLDLTARSHPDGQRIDLTWRYPDDAPADAGVRVVRRERTYPTGPDDGARVADGVALTAVRDENLHGETTYYYSLFPFSGSPVAFQAEPQLVSATATGRYDFAGLMYDLLPRIYRRYDGAGPPGPLRRFLDLPGGQLDELYSRIAAALLLHDVDRVDGSLLPLLAEWIGWRTDYRLSVGTQRSEIARAPQVYRTIGGLAGVEGAVSRVLGWPSRTKEYVHNVARTNTPEQLTLWSALRRPGQPWSEPELFSVNTQYDGRSTHARLADGSDLLLFHTRRRHGWGIWAKRRAAGAWSPSEPVVDRGRVDKNPAAAVQGNVIRLFWETCNPSGSAMQPRWGLATAVHSGAAWSDPVMLFDEGPERRGPAAATDGNGGVWLFWRERTDGRWAVRYNRHDGNGWQLDPAGTVPAPAGVLDAPQVEDDLVVRFDSIRPHRPLWLFWAGRLPGGPAGQTRWRIGWRFKAGTDPAVADWSPAATMPAGDAAEHDREPSPLITTTGVELYWASTRGGGWAVQRSVLDPAADPAAHPATGWSAAATVTASPFSQRAPLVIPDADGGTLLTFRSNRSQAMITGLAGDPDAPRALDVRYAGTTTVRSGDAAKRTLAGRFDDFQTYTCQGGGVVPGGRSANQVVIARADSPRIARDTIGVFVRPPTTDPAVVTPALDRLAGALPEFLPLTIRAVVVVDD
jgi:phage tail-like protein